MFKGPIEVDELDNTLTRPHDGQNMSMNMSDDQHTLVLNVHDGKKHLLATDKEGNIVFNGPIDTEEQRRRCRRACQEAREARIQAEHDPSPRWRHDCPGSTGSTDSANRVRAGQAKVRLSALLHAGALRSKSIVRLRLSRGDEIRLVTRLPFNRRPRLDLDRIHVIADLQRRQILNHLPGQQPAPGAAGLV